MTAHTAFEALAQVQAQVVHNTLPAEPATELADRIAQVDWHFTDAKTQGGVHSIHPYPAKFIPQLPRQLRPAARQEAA